MVPSRFVHCVTRRVLSGNDCDAQNTLSAEWIPGPYDRVYCAVPTDRDKR
jgi:hypothetical protein